MLRNRMPEDAHVTASRSGATIIDKSSNSGAAPCSCEQDDSTA